MVIAQITFTVKSEHIQDFIAITAYNVMHSLEEAGITRFEFFQETNKKNRFILFEIYTSGEAQNRHRETEHFKKWKSEVMVYLEEAYTINTYEKIEFTN